jgi:tetratricopeptide (TPR) repeat protein
MGGGAAQRPRVCSASAAGRGDARERAQQALEISRTQNERSNEAYAFRLLGAIASLAGQPEVEAAEGYLREALALATDLGMRPLVAHCHLGLGQLYGRTGKREEAHAHLTAATVMLRAMGMTYWLERVEQELKKLEEQTPGDAEN